MGRGRAGSRAGAAAAACCLTVALAGCVKKEDGGADAAAVAAHARAMERIAQHVMAGMPEGAEVRVEVIPRDGFAALPELVLAKAVWNGTAAGERNCLARAGGPVWCAGEEEFERLVREFGTRSLLGLTDADWLRLTLFLHQAEDEVWVRGALPPDGLPEDRLNQFDSPLVERPDGGVKVSFFTLPFARPGVWSGRIRRHEFELRPDGTARADATDVPGFASAESR